MLTRWTVNNFKSFTDQTSLSLSPLTMLCGANSSGKSSILQSMLLVKQTLEHSPVERVIALNGPLVQLGIFSDILNHRAASKQNEEIGLGWKINYVIDDENISSSSGEYKIDSVCIDFTFDTVGSKAERSTLELQPDLKTSKITGVLADADEMNHEIDLEIQRVTGRGRRIQYKSSTLGDDAKLRFRVIHLDDESNEAAGPSLVKSTVVGANVTHFAPSALIVRYDRNLRIAKQATKFLVGLRVPRYRLPTIRVPDSVQKIMKSTLQSASLENSRINDAITKLFDAANNEFTVELFNSRLNELSPFTRKLVRDEFLKIEQFITEILHKELGSDQTVSVARVETISRVANVNENFFRFRLRYLGPLRADPRPLYALQALNSPTDVGPKGEQTAAVLHLNAKRKIKSIAPLTSTESPTDAKIVDVSLGESVGAWLRYLGVAEEFETIEKGKLGHELRVKTSGVSEFQDLTNVGVGVSQILPIVVTCLLAAPGSTIILEQPELHLHPAVQARLADFFIAMILLKKQCIIETHSEHLIERIRYRVVQDRTNQVHESTRIYFFCKNSGCTDIKEIGLTRYGAIDDWPKDFFDQSQIANEEIVLMALERHKLETLRSDK